MRWTVILTDGREVTTDVPDNLPQHVQARQAEHSVMLAGRPFASRPEGCTGLSYRAHMGRSCPIHPEV